MSPVIESIKCHKVLNSRADWTIETHVELSDGTVGVSDVPDGASKGQHEALYVKVEKAIEIVTGPINDALHKKDPFDQKTIDQIMLDMDGTENKSTLGGNSILSVSLATAKAAAQSKKVTLYKYLAGMYGYDTESVNFPTPVFNVINGGKHAQNGLSFQEFMVIPSPNLGITKSLDIGVEIYDALRDKLEKDGYETSVGDEGGFAPEGFNPEMALSYIKEAASQKYKTGLDVFLAWMLQQNLFIRMVNI